MGSRELQIGAEGIMDQHSGFHPAQVVERTRRPESAAANKNTHKDSASSTLMLGVTPRDLAALVEFLDADSELTSLSNPSEMTTLDIEAGVNQVVTPLTTEQFDAVDVAQALSKLGYRGALQVLSPALPNPNLVVREMESAAQGVLVELITPQAAWRTLA